MSNRLTVLVDILASPCGAAWDRMAGDERVRFCRDCGKQVYNLSAMRGEEAAALIRERQGNLCVRLYRRRDGTVIAGDCPVGFARLRRALLLQVGALAAAFLAVPAIGGAADRARWREWSVWERESMRTIAEGLGIVEPQPISPPGTPGPTLVMGAMAGAP